MGEAFTVELKATGPAGTTFTFPGEAATDASSCARRRRAGAARRRPRPSRARTATRRRVFALGEAQVPPIPVRYRLADGTEGEASLGAGRR